MNVPRAIGVTLLLAFLGVFSALTIGTQLGRVADGGDDGLAGRRAEKAEALGPRDDRVLLERRHEHFRILYEGGAQESIGDRIANVLERGYRTIGKKLNSYPSEPITVILYGNREFQDLTRSPAWATGRYDGRIRLAVGGALQSPHELDRIVTHELVHAIVASAAPRGVPAWLNEGLASYLESTDSSWAAETIRNASSVVPLDSLVNGFSRLDEQAALVAYAESTTAAEILCAQLGANVGPFLQMVGNGSAVDDALLEFHVQPNAFHAEWRRRVGVR
jgi:Peptidase MA superfamily